MDRPRRTLGFEHEDAIARFEGRVVGTYGISRDITNRMQAEDAVRRAGDELADANRGLAAEIDERRRVESVLLANEDRHRRQQDSLLELIPHDLVALGADAVSRILEVAANTLNVERVSIWHFAQDHQGIRCLDLFERTPRRHTDGIVLTANDYPGYFEALASADVIAAADARSDPRTQRVPRRLSRAARHHVDARRAVAADGSTRRRVVPRARRPAPRMDVRRAAFRDGHGEPDRAGRRARRAPPRRGGTAPGEGRGRGGHAGQERVPGQHEPRDSHADERHHRHDRTGARHRADRRAARVPRHW